MHSTKAHFQWNLRKQGYKPARCHDLGMVRNEAKGDAAALTFPEGIIGAGIDADQEPFSDTSVILQALLGPLMLQRNIHSDISCNPALSDCGTSLHSSAMHERLWLGMFSTLAWAYDLLQPSAA